jgi:hypothetical protein
MASARRCLPQLACLLAITRKRVLPPSGGTAGSQWRFYFSSRRRQGGVFLWSRFSKAGN